MRSNVEWNTLIIPNVSEHLNATPRVLVKDHPLKATVVTDRIPRRILGSQPSTGRSTPVSTPSSILEPLSMALEGVDPLTAFAIEEMDPLTKLAVEEGNNAQTLDQKTTTQKPRLEPWNLRKSAILSKFTTSEKISIMTSFLSEGDKVVVKAQSTAVDKIQHRLEQLDYFEEGSQTKLDLSQAEYVNRIEQLNRELVSAWNTEQRVKALKIAIQCAKLLADTSVINFYPSKFVLVTDILDVFGHLVYNRLRHKTDSHKSNSKLILPENFTPDMVSDSAKETCLNWFYKIASIRELVPRIYVELALVKSYSFISVSESRDALQRIVQMINGIGNPLTAAYTRCYLCRVALTLPQIHERILLQNFYEFLSGYHHLFSKSVRSLLKTQKFSQSVYLTLYTPALDFMLQTVAVDAPDSLLNDLLDRCRRQGNSSLILNTIMSAFKPSLISSRTQQFLDMIENCLDEGIQAHLLLRTLGLCLRVAPPPLEHRRQILNTVWKHISSLDKTEEYISCVEPWVTYVLKYFSYREINAVLGDIIKHLSSDESHEFYYKSLKVIVDDILSTTQDLETLLTMDNFLPIVDLFQQESVKVEVCKRILSGKISDQMINDPVVVNALMFLCTILHDSVNALTPEDEYRQIGEVLCNVIRKVDYEKDFERQLSFYVEARGLFSNTDTVFVQLVQLVNSLSTKTHGMVKGNHSRKTADFVRACSAYCFITIPSVKSTKNRLRLYLLSGQVALFNQCWGQAEACFKGALATIASTEKQKIPESELVPQIKQFLALLLVVPDNPDHSVLSLVKSLINLLQNYEWENISSLVVIYLSALDMLSVMAQEEYPYHIEKVESNDSLYGSDPKFIGEINKMCCVIMGELLAKIQTVGVEKRGFFTTELLVRVTLRNNLNPVMFSLAENLWGYAAKNAADKKYLVKTRQYLKQKAFATNNEKLIELLDKMV